MTQHAVVPDGMGGCSMILPSEFGPNYCVRFESMREARQIIECEGMLEVLRNWAHETWISKHIEETKTVEAQREYQWERELHDDLE